MKKLCHFKKKELGKEIIPVLHGQNQKHHTKREEDLTWVPSLWITLSELEIATDKIGGYNQITCLTRRNSELIRPVAIATIEECDNYTQEIADLFGIGVVILHPSNECLHYVGDMLSDYYKFQRANSVLKKLFGLEVDDFLYLN